ncbi:hypothetical protein P0Y35_05820 [Kiritimatiellaeota bacterium B1221]|nr:hypothetical protein [Kiritimatiellaeota bacterium B1221]
MSAESKYREELRNLPAAGSGVHSHIMTLANLASLADITPAEAAEDIRTAMPGAPMPRNEVETALTKAGATCDPAAFPFVERNEKDHNQ